MACFFRVFELENTKDIEIRLNDLLRQLYLHYTIKLTKLFYVNEKYVLIALICPR